MQSNIELSTITFPEQLPFRPHDDTRRARSLSPAHRARPAQMEKLSTSSLTIREKAQTVNTSLPLRPMSHTSGITKNRRGNNLPMPIIAEEGVANSAAASSGKARSASTSHADPASNITGAQRVTRRKRRQSVGPFITHRNITRASLRPRRPAPVYDEAELASIDPAEAALSAALQKKPQVKLAACSSGLSPQVQDPTEAVNWNIANGTEFESDEEVEPEKEHWSAEDLKDEKNRRLHVFNAREKGFGAIRLCHSCGEHITGTRYECRYCVNFDLCIDCYTNPATTYKHQHEAGGRVFR